MYNNNNFQLQSNLGVVTLFSVKNRTSEKNLKYGIFPILLHVKFPLSCELLVVKIRISESF